MRSALDNPAVLRATLGACVALVALQAAAAPLWDADLGWLLRAGEDLLRERALPRRNRYGFTAPDAPWVMHEWLLGALSASLHRAAGIGGVALLRIAAAMVCAGFAWRLAAREARPVVAVGCVGAALALFGSRFESARPIGLAYAPAMVVAWAAFAPTLRRRHALAALVATLAWTNAHGSFPLALGLLAAGLIERPSKARAGLLAGCALATLVNPYGLAMHGLVLRYLSASEGDAVSVTHARIVEWWPLLRAPRRMYSVPELLGFLAVVALALHALAARRFRWRAALSLALCAMALAHQRHLQLAGLLSLPLLAPTLARAGAARAPTMRLAFALPLALALATWVGLLRHRDALSWWNPTRDPGDFSRLQRALGPDARVFVTLPFAGFAVHRGVRVFFDPRNDCYPAAVLRDALDLDEGLLSPGAAERALQSRGTTHAIGWCDGRASRSLAAWEVRGREGRLCLWAARANAEEGARALRR